MATLDEMAGKGFKQNRNVGYEKPPKSFSREKVEEKSTTLIDQPGNTRDYHYPSGEGDVSPIRNQSKHVVGSRKEDGRFIRPINRLNNQKLGGIEKSVTDGKREYHGEPCGKVEPIGKESIDGKRGYHYPSGEGEKSPIVGKVISTKNGRR